MCVSIVIYFNRNHKKIELVLLVELQIRSHTGLIGVLRPVNVAGVIRCHYSSSFDWMKLISNVAATMRQDVCRCRCCCFQNCVIEQLWHSGHRCPERSDCHEWSFGWCRFTGHVWLKLLWYHNSPCYKLKLILPETLKHRINIGIFHFSQLYF